MLSAALQRAGLLWSREQGLAALDFELDSTDPDAMKLLAALPAPLGEALLTYHSGAPGA